MQFLLKTGKMVQIYNSSYVLITSNIMHNKLIMFAYAKYLYYIIIISIMFMNKLVNIIINIIYITIFGNLRSVRFFFKGNNT